MFTLYSWRILLQNEASGELIPDTQFVMLLFVLLSADYGAEKMPNCNYLQTILQYIIVLNKLFMVVNIY